MKYKDDEKKEIFYKLREWLQSEIKKIEDRKLIDRTHEDEKNLENNINKKSEEKSMIQDFSEISKTTIKRGNKANVLIEIAQYVDSLEQDRDKILNELRDVQSEKKKFESLFEKYKTSNGELKKSEQEKSAEVEKLVQENQQLKKQIIDLQTKVEKIDSVLSIYSSDQENSESEKLNSIASKLKGEYKDFIESVGMEMTVDLGLNLRDQIEEIFKILMKNGIDVKGR
ncbi:MAG: hypothetical protein PHR06_16185 [Candidatus Cloacimonetes bacterium]|nr:hypothetical protein [Candidatus Cloacimonadota bacterium]